MEILFYFESLVILFIGCIVLLDMYRIWKCGLNLWVDMMLVGFDGFWIYWLD